MPGSQLSAKLKLRRGTAAEWQSSNLTLLDGEVAIVRTPTGDRLKIGDGSKTWSQLDYFGENKLETASLEVGYQLSAATGLYTIAQGYKSKALASNTLALGYQSQASELNSFVWNGDSSFTVGTYYQSHGEGTFSVNPLSGLDGFYVGSQTMRDAILSAAGSEYLNLSGGNVDWLSAGSLSAENLVVADTISADNLYVDSLILESSLSVTNGSQIYFKEEGKNLSAMVAEASKNFAADGLYFPVGGGHFRKVTIQYDNEMSAYGFVIATGTSSYNPSTGAFTDD